MEIHRSNGIKIEKVKKHALSADKEEMNVNELDEWPKYGKQKVVFPKPYLNLQRK